MDFANIIFEISRDTNPVEPGFQPSGLYIALCLIIPVIIGILAGIISSAIVSFVEKRTKNAGDSDVN